MLHMPTATGAKSPYCEGHTGASVDAAIESDCVATTQMSQLPLTPARTESRCRVKNRLVGTPYVNTIHTTAAQAARVAVASGWPAAPSLTPSTSIPATMVKKPNTRSGDRTSVATLERKKMSRRISAPRRTRNPAQAKTNKTLESHEGPRREVPVEMMPVAITNAK